MAFKPKFETETVGNTKSLELGEVNAIQYKRVKDNTTGKSIENDRERYRINEKIRLNGKRYQLNGTLTEIIKKE